MPSVKIVASNGGGTPDPEFHPLYAAAMSDARHHHSHDYHPGHGHSPVSFGRAYAIGIGLNLGYVAVEAGFGFVTGSLALLSDAAHNLGDVLALVLAWAAMRLAARPASARFTYGWHSASILAAFANSMLLTGACGVIVWESAHRLLAPPGVSGGLMMAVAGAGVVVNVLTALLFMRGRHDINVRAAFAHMAADALVSLGVMVAGGLMLFTGWLWLDPVIGLAVALVIVAGSWRLLRESAGLALHAAPEGIDTREVRGWLLERPGVSGVHDLHVWPIGATETALTVHLVMPDGHPGDVFLVEAARELERRFGIGHATLQLETGGGPACPLEDAHR